MHVFIHSIVIYNRMDCCEESIDKAYVTVDGKTVGIIDYEAGKPAYVLDKLNVVGREITVWGGESGALHMAEVEVYGAPRDVKCVDFLGRSLSGGEQYRQEGKLCECTAHGIICRCDNDDVIISDDVRNCPVGQTMWVNQDICTAMCIRHEGYCTSSGDPHYKTFDLKYYDFNGKCTYQAASCEDFVVYFKNVQLHSDISKPRHAKRIEVVFKGTKFAISNQYQAFVNDQSVQVPYYKTHKNGDRIEIVNYGQLEINLYQYSKDKLPALRVRATDAGTYIHAELWLHGSCGNITEGLCGNWNGDSGDDLRGGSANSLGMLHQKYDEHCPPPPPPEHPCDDVHMGYELASTLCDTLKHPPFALCHSAVPMGNTEEGVYHNCMSEICTDLIRTNSACSQYENYVSTCYEAGIDLSGWREVVNYCPYECPKGLIYMPKGPVPTPTCLDQHPALERTIEGCFCPSGLFLQDGTCVHSEECKCLYEGAFYHPGDIIREEGECQECECLTAGRMTCTSISCPELSCEDQEIVASKEDLCCPFCESSWVEALNPTEMVIVGQELGLTCQVNTGGVTSEDISWYKGDEALQNGVSASGLVLRISGVSAAHNGTYTCSVQKGESWGEAVFTVNVMVPVQRIHIDPLKTKVTCKAKKGNCVVEYEVFRVGGGDVDPSNVSICKKLVEGGLGMCKIAWVNPKGVFTRRVGEKTSTPVSSAGVWVCVVVDQGEEVVSPGVIVRVK